MNSPPHSDQTPLPVSSTYSPSSTYDPEDHEQRTGLVNSLRNLLIADDYLRFTTSSNEVGYRKPIEDRKSLFVLLGLPESALVFDDGLNPLTLHIIYTASDGTERILAKPREIRIKREPGVPCQEIVDNVINAIERIQSIEPFKCHHCGAPKFKSRQNNIVCAEVCYSK